MNLNNLTDGKSDGLMILYVKDGTTYPVMLTEAQATMLDLVIAMPFQKEKMMVAFDMPQGNVGNLKWGVTWKTTLNN